MNNIKTIKTDIVGYGFSAKTFHIPFIKSLPSFSIGAISSSQKDNIKHDFPDADYYSTAEEMIQQSDSDLVIITAPNAVHFSLAKLALQNNKHVVLEKPFVTNIADGEALISLAKEKDLVLSVYHNRRWDGDFLTVKKLIEEQQLGDIKYYESHFDRFRPMVQQRWREQTTEGGGILFDLGSHLLDQALQLFGIPEAITAQCEMMREGSTNIDYFNLTLHYADKLAVLNGSMFSAGPNARFNVQGTIANYVKYGLDPQEAQLKAGQQPNSENWGAENIEEYGKIYTQESSSLCQTENGCYEHFYIEMADAINTGTNVPVSAQDALWNIKLIELAMQSSQLGKTLKVKS